MKTSPDPAARTLHAWREKARARALELGFSLVGFTTADPLGDRAQRQWRRWLDAGRAGEMHYLERPRPRRTHPRDLLAEARCVIVAAAGYYDGDHGEQPAAGANAEGEEPGKVARYAWGEDYHPVLRERLGRLGRWIEAGAPEWGWTEPVRWRATADSAPLDERALAQRAGLGFIGKNTLLLHPERGSWFLLAELLVSVPFPPESPVAGSCGSCRKCLDACPTGAFPGPYELDPRRCISYLTIESRRPIPAEHASRMEGWVFGCDLCQEVCPYNERPLARLLPELDASRGIGPHAGLQALEGIESGKAFGRRWGHTPLARPGRRGMIRNLEAARSGRAERAEDD